MSPVFGHRAARSGSGARPASDAAFAGRLPQSGHQVTSAPMVPLNKRTPSSRGGLLDLPEDWRLVREREGDSYRWPKGRDRYSPYRVFMGTTRAEGAVQIGLGETIRENTWGRDRKYVVAFLSSGAPQQPLVEFVAADDYEQTRELVAVIRGSDGGRRMYGAGDALPRALHRTLPNPDLQRAGRLSRRLEQGRRGRSRGRRRDHPQPRADPKPTALPDLGRSASRSRRSTRST